ncbi:hypothetical protein [uncultured Aquimarina sp.]|uniref:hypothetical protein n=1 Tax=uncultured Aquimarina sp. TaxID=575652 RepID=UPI0026347CE8|nr:hypothetical protein [uncultured Aquimarina sp.]
MRKPIFTLWALFWGLGFVFAQSNDQTLRDIRAEYKIIINNLSSYKKVISDLEIQSTEGGEIIAYFDENDLKLIITEGYGETGKNRTEYYFKNQELFFVFDQRFDYNRPIYWNKKRAEENNDNEFFDPQKTKINADRYYFDKEKLFLWLDNEKNKIDLTLGTNTIVGKGLVVHSHKLRSELKKY